jgi:hypothetical protein
MKTRLNKLLRRAVTLIYEYIRGRGLPLLLYLAAFTLHTVFALFMEVTVPCADGIAGLLYAPAVLIFADPFRQYAAMLVINGAVVSFIPVLVYKIAARLGITRNYQRLAAVLSASVYPAVIMQSKLARSESLSFLFPCMIALLILTVIDTKKPARRHFLTIVLAFVMTGAVICRERMLAVMIAAVIAMMFVRFLLKIKVSLIAFFGSLFVFGMSAVFFIPDWISPSGLTLYRLSSLIEHLFDFTVSSWGLGILGVCLFVRSLFKLELSAKHNIANLTFGVFVFAALILAIDTPHVIPLVLVSVICHIFTRGLDLRGILVSIVAMGVIFTAFFSVTAGFDGLFLMVSAVFSLMSLFIVFVCCGGRYSARIVGGTVAAISLYSCIYVCAVRLPYERGMTVAANMPVYELSEYIYNSAESPPIIVASSEETVALLQFLNQHATVEKYDVLPENCFFVAPHGYKLTDEEALLLGETAHYTIYAVGERAILYKRSQSE